jgi:hypothetical protein
MKITVFCREERERFQLLKIKSDIVVLCAELETQNSKGKSSDFMVSFVLSTAEVKLPFKSKLTLII